MDIDTIETITLLGKDFNVFELAFNLAFKGFEVNLCHKNPKKLKLGLKRFKKYLKNLVLKGEISNNEEIAILSKIQIKYGLSDACKNADVIIEAYDEVVMSLAYLHLLNELSKPETIFAFNISKINYLNLSLIKNRFKNLVGINFFFPLLCTKRIQILKRIDTSDEAVKTIKELLKIIKKKVILYKKEYFNFSVYRTIIYPILLLKYSIRRYNQKNNINLKKSLKVFLKSYLTIIKGTIRKRIEVLKYKLRWIKIFFLKQVYKKRNNNNLKINIGGGTFFRKDWRVLDYIFGSYKHKPIYVDYNFDLTSNKRLPFKDNEVKFFYSSATVEHIPQEFCQHIFNETFRCLEPGGVFRFSTPDFDLAYDAFKKKDKNAYRLRFFSNITEAFIGMFASYLAFKVIKEEVEQNYNTMKKVEFANYYSERVPRETQKKYAGFHINWWNYDKAEEMLKIAGFKKIYRSYPQKSKFKEFKTKSRKRISGFDVTNPKNSLFVEAVKGEK